MRDIIQLQQDSKPRTQKYKSQSRTFARQPEDRNLHIKNGKMLGDNQKP